MKAKSDVNDVTSTSVINPSSSSASAVAPSKKAVVAEPPKLLYEKTSLIRNYPFPYGKEYEVGFVRDPKPKASIVDPKIFPTGKDDGKGASKIVSVYVDHVLNTSQRKHQTQEIRLQHFTDTFLGSSFDDQLQSVELNNIPLASSISIQKSLNKPDVTSNQKKFFITLTSRLKSNDGLLIYARLQNMNINDHIMKYLCSGISRNTRLKILMLHNNFITDKGLEYLCIAVRHHPTLHTLWIGSNRITDFGIKSLSTLISENTTIKELNVSNKFKKIAFSHEEEDIRPYLTYISADYLGNHLKKGSLLTSLIISHQKLYDDGAILLYHALPFCQLRSLTLTNNFISNKSCLVLQNILLKNPTLEQLSLSKNQVSDAGAIAIAYGLTYNHTLSMLDLSENEINQKGLYALYRTVERYNRTIKSLITVKNKYDDVRAELIATSRNNSVFSLGIRASMVPSPLLKSSSAKILLKERQEIEDETEEQEQGNVSRRSISPPTGRRSISPFTRGLSRSGHQPSQKEIRKSLLLNYHEDYHILDEITNINDTIASITESNGQDDVNDTPKMIAKSLSRSVLIRANSNLSFKGPIVTDDADDEEDEETKETKMKEEKSPKKSQLVTSLLTTSSPPRTKKSFIEKLQSPFTGGMNVPSYDSFSSSSPFDRKSISVPGIGIHGMKPINLQSIHEDYDMIGYDNENNTNLSIQDAIATAVRIAESRCPSPNQENLSSSLIPLQPPTVTRMRGDSLPSSLNSSAYNGRENTQQSSKKEEKPILSKKDRRLSANLGKTLGIPNITSIGIKPIRTKVSGEVDSGQHLMYLRVATEHDPEDARPTSLIKIGLDNRAERERIMKERQDPRYKAVSCYHRFSSSFSKLLFFFFLLAKSVKTHGTTKECSSRSSNITCFRSFLERLGFTYERSLSSRN
jgi:Ran GTPase-activating protein (RanGAP) involved in mRNA processing and transport